MKRSIVIMIVALCAFVGAGVVVTSLDAGLREEYNKAALYTIGATALIFGLSVLFFAFQVLLFIKNKIVKKSAPAVGIASSQLITVENKPEVSPEIVREINIDNLSELIVESIFNGHIHDTLNAMKKFSDEKEMPQEDIAAAVVNSLDAAVTKSMDDGIFSEEEEETLLELMSHWGLKASSFSTKSTKLLTRGRLIRRLINGEVKPVFGAKGLPFNFQKKEVLIWGWGDMPISELKTKSKIVGRSSGVSIRIMKGVYWRTGGFQGERVSTQELTKLGVAIVAVTSKHLYYSVGNTTKRIKHDKIISIEPYSDAVAIGLDGARANPLCFYTDNPWFFANVIQNASNWD